MKSAASWATALIVVVGLVARVMAQLKKGEAKILFDPESESVTIVSR